MVSKVLQLSARDARRLAVRAGMLCSPRPTDLLDTVRSSARVQVDLTAAVAPSPDLVCWSRLGPTYRLGDLQEAVQDRSLIEYRGFIHPQSDLALLRAIMRRWPGDEPHSPWQQAGAEWVDANFLAREDILARLHDDGPLPASAIEDTCEVPWRSSGWTNNQNVVRLIDFMEARGEVAVADHADNGARLWDLAERVHGDPDASVEYEDACRHLAQRQLRALGIARARTAVADGARDDLRDVGVPAEVLGTRGSWRVDPALLDTAFRGRAVLLSPLDRLVFDRKRMVDLFDFDYQLEMYKPKSTRRWGYWAMPILYGDRLVGKVDATADHRRGRLRLHAIHRDVEFTGAMIRAVDREIHALATWLGLELQTGNTDVKD